MSLSGDREASYFWKKFEKKLPYPDWNRTLFETDGSGSSPRPADGNAPPRRGFGLTFNLDLVGYL